mgnify:CR=1 FL=1
MRTLAKYLQNYKKESVLAPFFKFLEVVFDLLVPVVKIGRASCRERVSTFV